MWKMLARSQLILLGAILASFLVSLCSDRFDPYFVDVTIGIGINIILAVSLNLINGFAGQFSLGHAGFMAVGAYSAAVVTTKNTLIAFELATGTATKTFDLKQRTPGLVPVFSADGRLVLTSGRDGDARVFDGRTGRLLHALHHEGPVTDVAFGSQVLEDPLSTAIGERGQRGVVAQQGRFVGIR